MIDPPADAAAVATRARTFFEAHAQRRGREPRQRLVGAAFRHHPDERAELDRVRAHQAALFDAGLAWLTGPRSLGGAGLDDAAVRAFWEVAREYEPVDANALIVGLGIIAPAIVRYGTAEQQARWLPALHRGDIVGCQLFSEPDAGSDLASLRTRAVPVDGGWVITGQKVWSSGAHLADIGELLARTDPDPSARHRGLSMFVVDMRSRGLEVRPVRQMNGSAHFCEVHLDEVFIPGDRLLGEVGSGWAVAQVSLSSERGGFADDDPTRLFLDLGDRLIDLARARGRHDDPVVRARLADAWSRERITRWLAQRLEEGPSELANVAPSLLKLFTTGSDTAVAAEAGRLLGPDLIAGAADESGAVCGEWADVVLGVPAPRIAGGTDEIQRNIIAERGLGLPREPAERDRREGRRSP